MSGWGRAGAAGSRRIFSGSAAGVAAAGASPDTATEAATGWGGIASAMGCACGFAPACMGRRRAGAVTGWLPAPGAWGASAICSVGLVDLAGLAGGVDATDGARTVGGVGASDVASFVDVDADVVAVAGLLATAGIAVAGVSLASAVLATGSIATGAGLPVALSSCVVVTATVGAVDVATAAGGAAAGTVAAACRAGAGACHKRWLVTAATSSSTPPATAASLNFIVGAGLAGTARTCP